MRVLVGCGANSTRRSAGRPAAGRGRAVIENTGPAWRRSVGKVLDLPPKRRLTRPGRLTTRTHDGNESRPLPEAGARHHPRRAGSPPYTALVLVCARYEQNRKQVHGGHECHRSEDEIRPGHGRDLNTSAGRMHRLFGPPTAWAPDTQTGVAAYRHGDVASISVVVLGPGCRQRDDPIHLTPRWGARTQAPETLRRTSNGQRHPPRATGTVLAFGTTRA